MKKKDTENSKNTHIKVIQVIIVVILLISTFYTGKLSMSKQVYALYDRIDQLEVQINQIQVKSPVKTVNTP